MDRNYLEKLSREELIEMCLKKDESEAKCRSELKWIHQLMANTSANGDEKETAYWIRFHMKRKESRDDGLFHIYNADIIKDSGIDDKKLGKVLKKFEERRVISRDLKKIRDNSGRVIGSENWMVLDGSVLVNPRDIDFGKNTKHGGVREKNPCGCGCEERITTVHKVVACKNCGSVLEETKKTLGENDLDLDPDEEIF